MPADAPRKTTIPGEELERVEEFAQQRAKAHGLEWAALSAEHQRGIMDAIWQEMNWRD